MLVLLVLSLLCLKTTIACERWNRMTFSVSSWRNESGHRLIQADLGSDVSDQDSISLLVDLWSEKCDDTSSLVLNTQASSKGHSESVAPSTTVSTTIKPPPDYHHIPGFGYYKKLPNKTTWLNGVQACEKEGSRMVLLESQEELEVLYKWAGCCSWVGVHRASPTSPWINVLGEQMNSTHFFGWLPSYPNNRDCMLMNSASTQGTTDLYCNELRSVICEQTK